MVFAAGLAAAELVRAEVGDDAVDPGIERALKAEVADVAISLEEGCLVDVFGVVLVAGEVQCEAQNLLFVLFDQGVKGDAAARLGLADQLRFRRARLQPILFPVGIVDCPARSQASFRPWAGLYRSGGGPR